MIAFCTVFDSVSSTTKSNGLSCARIRFPPRRSRNTSSRYTITGRTIFSTHVTGCAVVSVTPNGIRLSHMACQSKRMSAVHRACQSTWNIGASPAVSFLSMTLPLQHPIVRPNRGSRKPDAPRPGWRERIQALKHVPRLLRLVWRSEPRYVAAILVLRVLRSLVPLVVLWIGKLIVDEVVHAIAAAGHAGAVDWMRLAELLALELAIALVGEGLARLSALLESLLGDLFANRTSVELMRHAATLDLEQFEDAELYDKLERARRQTVGRIGLFTLLLSSVQDAITLVTLAAALAVYVPWLLALLVIAVLPSLLGETHFASLGYSLLYSWTPERRQLDYLRYIGASDISAKELKLFGLSDFLVERYDRLSTEFYEANKRLAVRRSFVSTLLAALGTLGYYGAYAVIIYLTVIGYRSPAGLFTIGVLTFLSGSFRQSRDLIQRVLLSLSQVFEQSLYLDDLFSFLEIEPHIRRNPEGDRKSTRLNSSHMSISYAVFCLKKKNRRNPPRGADRA